MASTMRKLIPFANLLLATSLLLSMPSVTNGRLYGNENGRPLNLVRNAYSYGNLPTNVAAIGDMSRIAAVKIPEIATAARATLKRVASAPQFRPIYEGPTFNEEEKKLLALQQRQRLYDWSLKNDMKIYDTNKSWADAFLRQYKGKPNRQLYQMEVQHWHGAHLGAKRYLPRIEAKKSALNGVTKEIETKFAPNVQEKVHEKKEEWENEMLEHHLQNNAW